MKTGIIGLGSLGTAILRSIHRLHKNTKFIVSSKSPLSVESIKHFCKVSYTNRHVSQESKYLFLCVKPNDAKEVCQEIRGHLCKDTVVISCIAAVPFNKLQEWLNHENVIKTMPTMSIPKGPVVVYNPLNLNFETFSEKNILVNDENILDMSTAVSGCMPGFLANVTEQWIEAAIKMGMDQNLAEKIICANVAAFEELGATSKDDLRKIQSVVASEGGATEKGLIHLNHSDINLILGTTMGIANNRILDLAKRLRE